MTRGNRIQTDITANPRGFIAGINQASSSLDRATKSWKAQLAGFNAAIGPLLGAAGLGVAARSFDQLAENAVRAGDSIGKAARTAGIGAESLQQYREAAELTGTSQQQLDDALGRFTRRLGEARRGNRAYAEAFRELGVEITDTNEQALDKTFRVLGDIDDITIRTSLATKVFGDDARRMALIVEDGAAALERMKDQARESGRVLSDDLVSAAERTQDRLTTMENTLRTRLNTAMLENIDGFLAWREAINAAQIALVNLISKFGDLNRMYRRFLGLRASDDIRDLRIQYADLGLELDKQVERLEKLQGRGDSILPGINQARQRNIVDAEQRINDLKAQRLELLEEIRQKQQENNALDENEDDGGRQGFNPPTPSLKNNESGKADKANFENRELARAAEKANEAVEKVERSTTDWRLESERAGQSIADAFSRAIVYGDSLGQTLKRLSAQLASRALSNFLLNAVGGGLGGGGSLFGGFLASGGPVAPGRSYVVGEQGPELFTPSTAGRIIPNGASIDGGVVVNQTLRFDVGLETVDARVAQVAPMISAATYDAIEKGRSRPRFA